MPKAEAKWQDLPSEGKGIADDIELLTSQKAITILQHQHDHQIFAYLRFARSLRQNILYFPGHGSLSIDQVRAIWSLRDCSDDAIRTWLKQAREPSDSESPKYPQGDTLQEPGFASLSSFGQVQVNLHAPAARAPPNLVQTENFHQTTLVAPWNHPQDVYNKTHKTNTSPAATKAPNVYWCTICEDRHSYKGISDWRKHEREHVMTYVCMYRVPIDENDGCVKCFLCGMSNPNEEHLREHNTQTCGKGVTGSFSCKRRADLVRHLEKCHNVEGKARREAVADKWKETTEEQAWSCGFCVQLFHTFEDRLKHIAKHFENGQTLDEWDVGKVIEGLLSQPGMAKVWKMPRGWKFSESVWKKDLVKKLQRKLELGPSDPMHATALVEAVYNARQSVWDFSNNDEPITYAPMYGPTGPSPFASTRDHNSMTTQVFQPSSSHEQSQFVNPADTVHHAGPVLVGGPMAIYNYDTPPLSFSDGDGSSTAASWPLSPGQAGSSAADSYNGYGVSPEQSSVTNGMCSWSTPVTFNDDPNDDSMLA